MAAVVSAEAAAAESIRCLTEAVYDVEMSTVLPGTVAVIHAGEGSFVKQGAVVLELESRSEQLDIERREVLVANLKATMERSEKLLQNTSSISLEEVDESRSNYRIAAIELESARDLLEKKRIKAPFTGIVTTLPVEVGEYCEPPDVVLRMVDVRQFNCIANVDPALAARMRIGDRLGFSPERPLEGGPVTLEGEVVFISPVVDPASGLLRIEAIFANPDNLIKPGEGGYLQLQEGQ